MVDTDLAKKDRISPVQIYKVSIRKLPLPPDMPMRLTSVPEGYVPFLPAWSELSSIPFDPFKN
jgi:hypothetical protein